MATLTHKCPHCLTEHIALRAKVGLTLKAGAWKFGVHLDCPKCSMPACAVVFAEQQVKAQHLSPANWDQSGADLLDNGYVVEQIWPAVPGPLVPEGMPDDVVRIYLQAERNFPVEGNEEAAGTMYRKALDVGLKKIDPQMTGLLAARIKKLAADGKLTPDIAEWADQVRDLGNEAAHEETPPTRDELTDLRNFTEMVMRYLFSLPALVTSRRSPPATK